MDEGGSRETLNEHKIPKMFHKYLKHFMVPFATRNISSELIQT